ncbi:unnamed protein product [Peronospora farinosa]|uniref:RxLR effector protein n=1 Tax=Peronospora farinosa TaxID=134698 RepID=A0AAV0STF6_9STRA|nr:unnamed protein product [Peronospora farinosa]
MIANPNPNLPKRLQWYIVLAALTCVSASPSTVEPKTIFAGSAALKQPLGVVGQSDARVKRYLRKNSDATESMDDENEDRGGNLGSAVDQGLAGAIDSVEGGVTSGVSAAIDQGLPAKVGEAGKSDVIPGDSGTNHNPAAKVEESIEAGVIPSVPAKVHDPAATVANKKTRSKANRLAKHQLKIWQERGIDVIRSYELLELNKEHPDTLLRNPMLSTWINYVEMLGPDPYEVLILAMRKQVGDKKLDSILAAGGNKLDSILAAAKVDDTNARIRRTLLHMQEKHQSWVRLQEYPQAKKWRKNGKSVGDVLDLLKVQHNGEEMLGTKDWDAWVAYVTFLEKQKQPKDQSETATVIYAVLKNRFSSEGLAKLVATAKTVESTKEIAGKWERSEWHIAQRTSDDVFNFLELKKKGDAIFESPEFESWALYVIELNSVRSRKDDVELAYQLYRHYGPDVERMLKQSEMMASEKNDEFTKAIAMMLLEVFERKKGLKEKGLVGRRL